MMLLGQSERAALDLAEAGALSPFQAGQGGDITAGLPPAHYISHSHVEWFSEENGLVVLKLEPEQVEVIREALPPGSREPVCRQRQAENMGRSLAGLCEHLARAGTEQEAP